MGRFGEAQLHRPMEPYWISGHRSTYGVWREQSAYFGADWRRPFEEVTLFQVAHLLEAVGHKADLNFGDCFAYACAKAHRLSLLYKGNDFSQTDLA